MDPPIHLPLPGADPKPAAGCGVCAALERQRSEARRARNYSLATDYNVEIRNHPHARGGRA
ncbi:hypothetical protein FEF34_20200 [Streptomyces marianii]|uniref:Uncharacterized protein n=2 Tax=Streptomyces marianii TaxID=1817406 RepID=A0A5R9EEA5_9ACTN|nr:hypothetical protein FEF34_20200 [Streptomyces marianii]